MSDICMFAASLPDELMDNETFVCGTDVGFGLLEEPLLATKFSPSHQSDSGCSDLFDEMEDRSVSPTSGIDIFEGGPGQSPVNLFDFDFNENEFESIIRTDQENIVDSNIAITLAQNKAPVVRASMLNLARSEASSPEINVEDDDSSDPSFVPYQRVVQSKAIVSKIIPQVVPKADVIQTPAAVQRQSTEILRLPATSTVKAQGVVEKPVPAIKVVKVIKTGATTHQQVENELFHALDERNKKNAVQAKINRERKKAYIKTLEDEIEELKAENAAIKAEKEKDETEKLAYKEEVEYLKSVLANQSAISRLLNNIDEAELMWAVSEWCGLRHIIPH
ncbi:uncharacterized protein LOC128234365 [Mya arenaria]|uniref:uncharacterized protein LOC128234365 n=1 Tax=Mya arenaria TaxID=6604 RepID=UPI0022E1641E|nr:uncharacterized protein LOC128234365 [Mya arenaria]